MFYECNCDGYSTPPATTKYDGKELWALGSLKSNGFRVQPNIFKILMLWNQHYKYCTYTHEITSDHISYIILSYIIYHISFIIFNIISYHIISHTVSYHAMPCHVMSYHTSYIQETPQWGEEPTMAISNFHASSDPSILGRWFKQIREAVKWFQAKNDRHYFRWSETHSLRFLELPANLWEIFELFFKKNITLPDSN